MKNLIKSTIFISLFAATLLFTSCEKSAVDSPITSQNLIFEAGGNNYIVPKDSVLDFSSKGARAVDGSLSYKLSGNVVGYNQIKAFRLTASSLKFANPYLLQSYTNSGLINTYVCRIVGNSLIPIGDESSEYLVDKLVFSKGQAEGNQDLYLCFLGRVFGSNYDFALYTLPTSFPSTNILTKESSSTNIFSTNGQCVWYAYARVAELHSSGYITKESFDFIKNGLVGKSDRHARYWPSMIGGDWIEGKSTGINDKYKKRGMLVVWKFGTYGHIGFVESISEDGKKYTVSDFNLKDDEKYRTTQYTFGSDKVGGVYPVFLPLKLTN